LHSPGDSDSGARQVALGFEGTLYLTGGAGDDFATVAYGLAKRTEGSRRWLGTFPGAGISLAVNPVTGDVIVTGASSQSASRGNYTTIAYYGRRSRCRPR